MSSLRRLAWGVLFLLLVLGAGLPLGGYGLLASTAGTRWLLQTMAELTKSADFSLQIGEINGTLLDELQLREVRLRAAGSALDIETLALRWHPAALLARRLHVQALEFGGVRVQLPPPGPEPAEPPALPDLGLPLVVELERLRLDRLVVVQDGDDLAIETIAFGAHLDNAAWRVRELVVRGMGLDLTGEVGLGPQAPHPLDGRLAGSVVAPEIGPVQAELQLSGAALTPAFDLAVRSPAVVRVQGAANLVEPEPSFRLDASWPQLNWPLQGAPQVETSAGRLELRGSPSDYRLELTTQVRGEGLPATEVRLQGQGDSRGLRLAPLTLRSGSGELTAKGPVDWQPAVTWDLALQARDLDPGMQFPDWPGRLSGELQVTGRLGEQGPEVEVAIAGIKGQLRDQALQASGAIRYAAGRLQARALDLVSGPNRLRLDGRADQQFDLAFDLDAPDLAALYPGLAGRLQGQGKLTGTTTAPLVVARLDGRDLAYDRLQVGELQLQADWGTNGGTAVLHAAALRSGEQRISSLNADLSGTALSHALQFQAEAPSFSVALGASGSLANGSWRGTLQRLDLTEPVLGDWALVAPAALELGAARLHSAELCLAQGQTDTRLCLQGGWAQAAGLDASGRLRGLELGQFAARLPGEAKIAGQLAADFQLAGQPERPSVTLTLNPGDGLLTLDTAGGPLEIAYRDAKVSARFTEDQGVAELQLRLGDGGRANARVTLGAGPARALGGELSASFPDLRLVEGFVPTLEAVQGQLRLDLNLAGTLDAPRGQGLLQVLDASARLPAAGLELKDIALQLRGDGQGPLALDGGVSSGAGRLILAGTLDPAAAGGPAVELSVSGKNFQVAQLPEALVEISPELRLQGQGPYHLSGRLLVPKARIELKELPSGSVSVSDDEIVVGEEPPPGRGGPPNLTAAVQVELGKEVSFKGFGLSTGLTGVLDAAVDAKGPRLHGKIELRDGAYKAYGQNLKVEQGRLLFAGPPDNPEIDLRAVRKSIDGRVNAYLAMSGPLAKPRPRIYSEPALPEAEALAYLLSGRGLDQTSQQEGAQIAAAALSLGLSKGEPLLQQLGSRLGLDELRFESGTEGVEGSALLLGKYLNPDLYLGYTQGLFNPLGAVLLRLRLSENLDLESRASTEQAVDLFYRFEHD